MQAIIDGAQECTRDSVHSLLALQLGFPDWYGNNLDALFDCLTDVHAPIEITLLHAPALEAQLGPYAQALVRVLQLAAQESSNVSFRLTP